MEAYESFQTFLFEARDNLSLNVRIAARVGCTNSTIKVYNDTVELIDKLLDIIKNGTLKINYLNQFRPKLEEIQGILLYRNQTDISFLEKQTREWKIEKKIAFEKRNGNILQSYNSLKFNIEFFEKIGFLNENIVAIGANGSGKTILSNQFKTYLENNGIVISAQRILLVPEINSISNPSKIAKELKQYQARDKTNKNAGEFGILQNEFGVILRNLITENITAGNTYRRNSLKLCNGGRSIEKPSKTKLDRTFEIWNSLIEHRTIDCADGMNITAKPLDGNEYPAMQLSEGEKVILYLIAQVLQAPQNGFIVIDEPEMYLHKTILKKLWDILESERQDCLFIYLTHDLDFATSRVAAKKIWIKSFSHPDKWDIESIPENDIPELLLLELLGSRKNILFCEGQKGSIDERILSILLPNFTIMPTGSCFDVINHTKAFNRLQEIKISAFGIIDSDHHDTERLAQLNSDNIFSFSVPEVENLFLNEKFLNHLADQLSVEKSVIDRIKEEVIEELSDHRELQTSNYVSTKVNHYFKDSHVTKGNKLDDVWHNYKSFSDKINIDEWYDERLAHLDEIIKEKDYHSAIKVFNNKGLRKIVSKHFRISDFTERSIRLLQSNLGTHESILEFIPNKLKEVGCYAE